MRRVAAVIADNIKCFMIEPRCLIGEDESNGLFPGDFAEQKKRLRRSSRPFRRRSRDEAASRD